MEVLDWYRGNLAQKTQDHFTLMAKDRDHDIVNALETHPKAVWWKSELKLCVHFKYSVKLIPYLTGLSTECNFFTILFMWALLHKKL